MVVERKVSDLTAVESSKYLKIFQTKRRLARELLEQLRNALETSNAAEEKKDELNCGVIIFRVSGCTQVFAFVKYNRLSNMQFDVDDIIAQHLDNDDIDNGDDDGINLNVDDLKG